MCAKNVSERVAMNSSSSSSSNSGHMNSNSHSHSNSSSSSSDGNSGGAAVSVGGATVSVGSAAVSGAPNSTVGSFNYNLQPDDIEMTLQILDILEISNLEILVKEGAINHAPLYAIEAFSDALSSLRLIETFSSFPKLQVGGAASSGSKKPDKKKPSKKTTVKVTVGKSKKDEKKKTTVSKSTIVDCNIISKTYKGDDNVKESLERLNRVKPWYEYCMYTFRFNMMFNELDKYLSRINNAAYQELIRRIRYAFLVYSQMQHNYIFVYREILRLYNKDDKTPKMNHLKGYFYIRRGNNELVPMDAKISNQSDIQEAFSNRVLEYVDYISMDRFIITFNTLFSSLVYEFEKGSWPSTFSVLEYSVASDTFTAYYDNNVLLEFKINVDDGYPRPVNYKIYSKSIMSNYNYMGRYNNSMNTRKTGAVGSITIYNGGSSNMKDMLELWILTDSSALRMGMVVTVA